MIGKLSGEERFVVNAFLDYLGILQTSLPFILALSTVMYFAFQIAFDKLYAFRLIPIISLFNALLMLVFFYVNLEFSDLPEDMELSRNPFIEQDQINPLNGYPVYVNDKSDFIDTKIEDGLLFYNKVYFVDEGYIEDDTVELYTSGYIGENSIVSHQGSISIPYVEELMTLDDTGITGFITRKYIGYLDNLKEIYKKTFTDEPLLSSIFAIVLTGLGFFFVLSSISFFFNDKDIFILSVSTLFVVAVLGFLGFQYFLSLVQVIKFGIENAFGRIILPSILILIFSGLVSFGLIQLKEAIHKKSVGTM